MADKAIMDVLTPDLGTDHPVPVAEVFVKVGDAVRKEDPLLSLESEKAVMDLPSPYEGVVKEILVEADQEIASGALIMRIEVSGAETAPEPAAKPETPGEEAAPPPERAPEGDAPAAKAPPAPQPAGAGQAHASPSVRQYARELGVDLARVGGTGPKGRIRREDVQNFVKSLASGGGTALLGTGGGLPPAAYVDPAKFGSVREEALTGIQKISGAHLHASWVNIPHVTHYEKADITSLEAWRKELNLRYGKERKYTTLAFTVKALASVMKQFPRFNAVLAPGGDRIYLREYVNVGIAVDTPRGLLVPVIGDADRKGLAAIADEITLLAGKGRDGKLTPADMAGAGMTITNLGGIGGTAFTPIINPPETAILGLSRSAMEPVWNGEAFEPRLMLPLSLSYDHRVIDGALAAAFAARLAAVLGDLRNILL